MPIDASIPLQAQGIQLASPLNMLARAQGVQNMQQTNQLNAMQMQDMHAQRAMQLQQAQARAQALASLPPPPVDAPAELHVAHKAVTSGLMQPKDYLDLVLKPKPDRKLTVVGRTAIDPNTGAPVYSEPATPEKPPSAVQEYEYAKGQGYKGSFRDWTTEKARAGASSTSVSYGAPVAGVDASGNPVFFQPDKGGGAPAIIPGVKPAPPKQGEAQTKQIVGIDSLGSAVDEYVNALKGWTKADMVRPDRRAAIGTAYNNMMLQAKEAYNLGVLNGPDYSILQAVVMDPTKVMGLVTSNEAMAKQATDLKRLMNKTRAAISKTSSASTPDASADPLGLRGK